MAGPLTWFRTLRPIPPSMLLRRLVFGARRLVRSAFPRLSAALAAGGADAAPMDLRPFAGFFAAARAGRGWPGLIDEGALTIRLPGARVPYEPAPDWAASGLSRHAGLELHAFRYLEDIASRAEPGRRSEAWALGRRLVLGWLEACARPVGWGWDPYSVSLRVVNWLKFAAAFEPELGAEPAVAARIARSLRAQGRHLARNVEWHLRCNHLLENGRALLFLGSAFGDDRARRWERAGRRIVDGGVREQFFRDGCHVERSPMYHMLVLELLADCIELVRSRGEEPPAAWLEALSRACSFARAVLHPDGGIPLLNDSALGVSRAPEELLARAAGILGGETRAGEPSDSGFRVVRTGELFLVADCGAPSPPYNPAHSHAGALSFELSVGGRRAIVDTGVAEYAPGELRSYCRSTRAHDTLCVGGADQSEMWSSFRVGGRARCEVSAIREEAGAIRFSANCRWHGGAVVHSREWIMWPSEGVLVVDSVETAPGAPVECPLRFGPGWRVERRDGRTWLCEEGAARCWVYVGEPWRAACGSSPVWREFGRREEAATLALQAAGPFASAAFFVGLGPPREARVLPAERRLVVDGRSFSW